MAVGAGTLRVEGLRALARELGKADPKIRKNLGQEYKKMGQWLVPMMKSRMVRTAKGAGGTLGQTGIRPSASTTSARVSLSGANPRTLGDEFGSHRYRQFNSWRGNQHVVFSSGGPGYAVYPVIRENVEEIKERWYDAVEDALRGAYPERF